MKRVGTAQAKGNRAVGYIRVSDDSQVDGYSLDAQRAEISRWCKRRGYDLIKFYADEGLTAHTDKICKRPQLMKLLEESKADMFDNVVVHMVDRWARNVGVQRQALQQLGDSGIGFASVTEDVDFTTPAGRLLLTTMGGVAEFFSDQLGLHVKKAQRQCAESGLPVGPVTFGYCRKDKGVPPVKVDQEAEAVRESFHLRDGGQSYGHIARWQNAHCFHTREGHAFTAHAVKDILNNRFYCGYVKHLGREYKGKHEAIISEDLFQRVQDRKQRRESFRAVQGPKGLAQGIVACCNCGNRLQSDRHRGQVPLYRQRHAHDCPTNNTSTVVGIIDEQLATIVRCLNLRADWKERMAVLEAANHNGLNPDTLRDKRRRLGKAYSDGAFTDEEYHRRLNDIDCQLGQPSAVENPAIEEATALFSNISMLWNEATPEERSRLVRTLTKLVFIDLKTKQVTASWPTPAFRALFGVGIDVAPNTPIELVPPREATKNTVGVGGDGGELIDTPNTIYRYGCSSTPRRRP